MCNAYKILIVGFSEVYFKSYWFWIMKLDVRLIVNTDDESGVTYVTMAEIGFFGMQMSNGFIGNAIISRKESVFSSVCCGHRIEGSDLNSVFCSSIKLILEKYEEYKEKSGSAQKGSY